jgi:outer membrane lipase/esterase
VSANAASTYVFADSVHPTTAAHALLADYVKSLIDGPNAYSTMAEVPLAARAAHIRALDEGLVSGNRAAIGNLAVFAAGDNGKFDMSTTKLNPQTDSKNRTAAVGITFRASEGATIGFAVGKTTTDANMGSVGKFETNENVMSAFGSFKTGNWYMNFTGSVADLKFDNVTRYVKLGPVTRTNSSNTNGTNTSGSVTAGYDFAFGSASVGPFASYTSQSVSVSGFSENASANTPASTDLKISAQDRSSRVLGVGVRGSIKVGNWTPFARVSYDTENANRDRFVTATPMSIAQNLSYDIPAYKSGKRWVTSTLGVRGLITDHISASLVYTTVSSRSDIKQDGVTGSVAFAF